MVQPSVDDSTSPATYPLDKAKRSHKASAWQKYKDAKNAVTLGLRKASNEFINNSIANAFEEGDNKLLWKYVRALRRAPISLAASSKKLHMKYLWS